MTAFLNDGLTYRFFVQSEIERFNYFLLASEEKSPCFVTLLDNEKNKIYMFDSLLKEDYGDFELTWECIEEEVNLDLLKKNNIVKIDFFHQGIETHTLAFLRYYEKDSKKITVSISPPFEMVRFQRRTYPRFNVPEKISAKVSLDNSIDKLKNLKITNISLGGLAVITDFEENELKLGEIFKEAELELPFKVDNKFITEMQVAHIQLVEVSKEKKIQIGLKFLNISTKIEDSLKAIINQLRA